MGWKSSPTRAKNTNQVQVGWLKIQAGKNGAPKIVECCSWLSTSYAATPAPREDSTKNTNNIQSTLVQPTTNYTSVGTTDDATNRKGQQDFNPMLKLPSSRHCPHSAAFASMPAAGCMMLCAPSLKKLPTSNFRLLGPLSSSHSRGLCARCRRSPSPPYSLRKGATTTKSKNKDEFRVFSTRGIWHNLPTEARH